MKAWIAVLIVFGLGGISGCTTSYLELTGQCIIQQWNLASVTMRRRLLCDLPEPTEEEGYLRDREAMETNPFPDLFEENRADTLDPNLLEKNMGYPQVEEE